MTTTPAIGNGDIALREPPHVRPEAVVAVEDLHVSFRRGGRTVRALRGVSLEVGRGEILGLVGESGSGKSVLGLTLLGLLAAGPDTITAGTAEVCDTDMLLAGKQEARRIRRDFLGAVFQDPMTSLNPTMRIGAQVAEAAGSTEEARRLLDAVGVPDAASRLRSYPHELSGGLRQRVMIAMAVAGRPALVIADEPTTALDVTVQAQILSLLRTLRDELQTSFILITHDLGVAAQVADRIAVLYGGRLAEVGPTGDVLGSPAHPYTAGLLRSRLVLSSDRSRPIVTLRGEPPDPADQPPGCAFGPRCEFHEQACDEALPDMRRVDPAPSVAPVATGDGGSRGPAHQAACFRLADIAELAGGLQQAAGPWKPVAVGRVRRPAVLVHGVHKRFPVGSGLRRRPLHALRGVDLAVDEGEAVALVGESGCGKSTLLRAIAGLHEVDEGQIELGRGGRPQMVFQDAGASLTPWMSVGAQIGEPLRAEGVSRKNLDDRVQAALALVGLPAEVVGALPAQLSGGQRQRVALARATVVPPEVLLCDEPTSALDVSLAATVLNLIGRLRRELGMAVIFVTHDLAAARIVSDRIAVMYLGRVVEIGSAEALCTSPVHPYTTALLDTVPEIGRAGSRLEGEPANALAPPSGCEFHPRCPVAEPSCGTDPVALAAVSAAAGGHKAACPVNLRRRAD